MADIASLADLSHELERVALALASGRVPTPLVVHELRTMADGHREALAIALSYLLRHEALGTHADGEALAAATSAVVNALRTDGAAT